MICSIVLNFEEFPSKMIPKSRRSSTLANGDYIDHWEVHRNFHIPTALLSVKTTSWMHSRNEKTLEMVEKGNILPPYVVGKTINLFLKTFDLFLHIFCIYRCMCVPLHVCVCICLFVCLYVMFVWVVFSIV